MKQAVETIGEERFSKVDLERFGHDSEYVVRFWLHVQRDAGDRKENTVNLVVDIFMWRKVFSVEHIKEESISKV